MAEWIASVKVLFSEAMVNTVFKILGAILVLIIGFALIKWFMRLFCNLKIAKRVDPSAFSFLKSLVSIALKLLLVFIVAGMIGVPSASLIALLGSAGLAIGLALQGSLSNFAGGVMILLFKPFVLGDYVEAAGTEGGTVQDISIFYTTFLTPDNRVIVIPNGELSNKTITNYSRMPDRRVDLRFGVAYESEIGLVRRVMTEVARENPDLHDTPEPSARLKEFDDDAMIFELRAWCASDRYWDCCFDLREAMKEAFDRNGIVIPFPQLDIHTDPGETIHVALRTPKEQIEKLRHTDD